MYINTAWQDSTDTIKHSLPLDEWYSTQPALTYRYFKLPDQYNFDLQEMRQHIDQLKTISIRASKEGKRFSKYRGLGFFSRENSEAPLEDHFIRRDVKQGQVFPDDLHLQSKLPDLYEDDFIRPTSMLDEYFTKIFAVFKNKISKASLLELRAGGWLGSHVDFPYYKTIRLHASIKGCSNAWYEIAGQRFQIPEDGSWYFIDTGKYHSVWNDGPDHRVTLNVNLKIGYNDPMQLALSGRL